MIRPGEAWGHPATGGPTVTGTGGDVDLADLIAAHPGERVRFVPDATSDFARAVGLTTNATGTTELPVDALDLGDDGMAVNLVVLGRRPDRLRRWDRRRPVVVHVDDRLVFAGRATTVVVANGEFDRGADLVPRGHPGDGRLEVQVYALAAGERRAMRHRLPTGTHLPHPRIRTTTGHRVVVEWQRPTPRTVDGQRRPARQHLTIWVVANAARLLV